MGCSESLLSPNESRTGGKHQCALMGKGYSSSAINPS